MKKITLIVTAIIFSANAFCQITFQKLLGHGGSVPRCVKQTVDGGYIVAGSIETLPVNSLVLLIKTNEFVDTLSTKTYDEANWEENSHDMRQTTVGGYMVVIDISSGILLIKTDNSGDSLWT